MISKEIEILCESGLCNRLATYFVQKANEFESSIWIEHESRRMNAKSLLGIMSMRIMTGTTVTLHATGADAETAIAALEALLQSNAY